VIIIIIGLQYLQRNEVKYKKNFVVNFGALREVWSLTHKHIYFD
jgi:hypothetical protein